MSTRRDYRGYEELIKEEAPSAPMIILEPKLSKSRTVLPAANFFSSSSRKVTSEENFQANAQLKEAKKASKIHPIFSLFETKKKKKATARPEFSRYIQYVREGGFGDVLQTTSSKSNNMAAVK
ncbi:uncharacterized protein LOC132047832 [Lycium ferocissimum]|uniref:uncharacterized protein LOC132047832 n=1 Tax=Lycium ferocissimum TaxID=112874 RepID=UPI0028168B55|nr:uncharacterized protein LOC132047832 [Lycium ferocissimum]